MVKRCGFNTLFMTLYPLSGDEWWTQPAARNLVKDAALDPNQGNRASSPGLIPLQRRNLRRTHRDFGGSASRTIQCDGTRPSWICFHDDRLWDFYIRNTVELAKVGQEVPGTLDGIFLDPEAYGPECYLCFCDNCVDKFNAWAHTDMPHGLVKPDAWLHEHNLWQKYTVDWHDQEVRRHAPCKMRDAIHAVRSRKLQLSSLLRKEYPVAVGTERCASCLFQKSRHRSGNQRATKLDDAGTHLLFGWPPIQDHIIGGMSKKS